MGCSPCEPCPRAFRVTHGMACVTRWLFARSRPIQSGRHAGVLMVRAPIVLAVEKRNERADARTDGRREKSPARSMRCARPCAHRITHVA